MPKICRNILFQDELLETVFKKKSKIDFARFKGVGEMPAKQLRETTMNKSSRTLIRVTLPDAMAALGLTGDLTDSEEDLPAQTDNAEQVTDLVERLMGRNAEARYTFIQENAEFVEDIDV